jgi:hypothetical protein
VRRCRASRCCHRRRAAAKLPPTSRWRAAATADVTLSRCRAAAKLPPPMQHPRCCNRAAAVAQCAAAALRAATTAALPPTASRTARRLG